jgi:hypothetical protein
MVDWGIPNWLDAISYGDIKKWSEYRWRWEFVRRREDCRNDFLAHKDETFRTLETDRTAELKRAPNSKRGRLLQPGEAGFTATVPGCYEKYGLRSLPNPAIGDQPFYVIIFVPRAPKLVLWADYGVSRAETEAVTFDLNTPIAEQLDRARGLLERRQRKLLGKLVPTGKKHPTKWLSYLRVLDAKGSGASLADIARSGILKGRREDPQAARDVLKQAEGLCFKWPA